MITSVKETQISSRMESDERPSKMRKLHNEDQSVSSYRQDGGSSTEIVIEPEQQPADGSTGSIQEQDFSSKEQPPTEEPKMSKNARKRLARQKEWEDGREGRRQKRKEKQIEKRERKRAQRAERGEGLNQDAKEPVESQPKKQQQPVNVPLTFLVDCGFDEQMTEKEIVSLSNQVTRCYSENRKSIYRPTLAISSFGGRLKTRFETALRSPHVRWTNFVLEEGDFVEVAQKAKVKALETSSDGLERCAALAASHQASPENGEIVYLTADSDDTLEELRPFDTYIIGGIVDRNRHKGICYKRAKDRNIKTAKLPIGEFMQMNSRAVLTTNHVYEIMLRWLELRDWGEAFMKVIPKRKGGVLKSGLNETEQQDVGEENDVEDDVTDAGDKDPTQCI